MMKKVFWRRPGARRKETTVSDRDLAIALQERIEQELPASGRDRLRFYVREGVVTIYGSVLATDDRRFVKHLVRHTPGVTTVFDHLTVDAGAAGDPTHS